MTAIDDQGAEGSASAPIRVLAHSNQNPTAALAVNPQSGAEPLVVELDASGSWDPDGRIVSYRFEFGDRSSQEQTSPLVRHTYMAGTWSARVTVTDERGGTASVGTVFYVTPSALVASTIDPVTRFAAAWNQRSLEEYRRLLPSDFRFSFAPGDPAGDPYPDRAWSRDDEVLAVGRLFSGGWAGEPPATAVDLRYLQNPIVGTSYVPGRSYPWHAQVLVPQLSLDVLRGLGEPLHAEGKALFSVVRGDSAHLPQELLDLGVRADSTVWFIEGWRDLTGPDPPPNQPPVAALALTPPSGVDPVMAWVDASRSHDDDGTIVGYRFDFGDGVTVARSVPFAVHTFVSGTWTVRVTAIDDQGAEATDAATINVWPSESQPNLVNNPSFETDTRYWNSYAGSVLLPVGGGHEGAIGLQVTGPSVMNGSFGVNDSPDIVRWTLGPGIRYRYSAWVRSPSSHGQAKLRIQEYLIATGAKIGLGTSAAVTLSPSWQQLTLDYTTTMANSTLDFQVRDFPVEPSEVFITDDISVRNITSPGAGTGMAEWRVEMEGEGLASVEPRLVPIPIHDAGMLRFVTAQTGPVRVEVLDLAGRRVRRLMDEREAPAGIYELPVRRGGEGGARLGPGVYFWRIVAREGARSGRFVVLP